MVHCLAQVVEKRTHLGYIDIGAKLSSKNGRDFGSLYCMV